MGCFTMAGVGDVMRGASGKGVWYKEVSFAGRLYPAAL